MGDTSRCADHGLHVVEVVSSSLFRDWLNGLRDRDGRARIVARITRLQARNPGDVKPVGAGVSKLRIKAGPGYRVYVVQRNAVLIVLLAGGDKATQAADSVTAKAIAEQWGKV